MDTANNNREQYSVDRSPIEVRQLWEWAKSKCAGKLLHEDLFARGVYVTMQYFMRENDVPPQSYHGLFTLGNIIRQTHQQFEQNKQNN